MLEIEKNQNFGKFKMATCTMVRVEVMNMSYDFLTFIVARL